MYKLTYTGKDCLAFVDKLLNQECYASFAEALENKKITCQLLNIPSNQIEIEKIELRESKQCI